MNRLLIDLPKLIETPKLNLKMPCAGMGTKLYAAIIDGYEDYVKWLNWPSQSPTLESVEEDVRKHHAEFILRETIRYLIFDKSTDELVGRCAFQANWVIPQFGISYFICKKQRLKGYATQAAHALAVLAFKVLKAKKLEIYCDAENLASTQIPLKLGFNLEYSQKGGWPRPDGKLAHLNTYSMFSADELADLEIKW